ncbi:MAG: hypothetical protein ABSH38_05130 [Verrucomicrobiota bacterium]|jgi:uncharacterized repeat protein (TIGR01451 family)
MARAVLPAALFLVLGREVTGQGFNPGTPVDISQYAGNEVDPAVAISPLNTANVFVAAMSDTSNGLFAAISANQGQSWTKAIIANGKDKLVQAYGEPSVAWDAYGNLYVAYLPATYEGVAVAISTNNGKNFSALTNLAAADATDTPRIATGPNGSNASVWVVYKDYTLPGMPLVVEGLLATNLGTNVSFGPPLTIPGSANGGFPDIAIGPAGQVMVAYQTNLTGSAASRIFVSVNTNAFGTNAFSTPVIATGDAVGGLTYIPAQPNGIGVSATPGLAFDLDPYSLFYGRAYLVYSALGSQGNMFIGLRYSINNGARWSAETTVNDDATGNSHFFPRVAVDPATGIVGCSWYDCRNDLGAESQMPIETGTVSYVFPNINGSNIVVITNGIYNATLSVVTNSPAVDVFTVVVTATNLPGDIVASDGVQNIFLKSTLATYMDLELSGDTSTNAQGINSSVTLTLMDLFPNAFTAGNMANQEPMMYATISTNGGVSFMANKSVLSTSLLISPDAPINPPVLGFASKDVGSGSALGFGNYTGLAFSGGNFYPVWADNSDFFLKNPNGVLSNFDLTSSTVVVPSADLALFVTNSPNPVLSAGVVVFSLVVINNGPNASTCVVTDTLPANVTFESVVPAVGASYSVNGQTVVLTFPSISAKTSLTNLIRVTATSSGYGTNFAIVSGPLPDTVPSNNVNTLVVLFAGEDLGVSMASSSSNVFGGQTITNTITVSNLGPAANQQVLVSNLFSANWGQIAVLSGGWTQALSATSPGTYSISNNLLVLNLGTLSSNQTTNIMVSALALATTPTAFDLVSVFSLDYDPNLANNAASITTAMTAESLGIGVSTSPTNSVTGMPLTFTINVTNFGPSSYGFVTVTDTVPAGFNSITVVQSPNPATVQGNTISFPVGVLASNTAATLVFTAVPQIAGTVTNTAVASSFDYAPNVASYMVIAAQPPPPPIENFVVIPGGSGAFLVWDTPVSATAQAAYGLTPGYGSISSSNGPSTHHIILLTGLLRDTNYYFNAWSWENGTLYSTNGSFGTTNSLILNTQDASYTGLWTASSTGIGIYGAYYQSANTTQSSSFTASATYTPVIPVQGNYNISIWYPESSIFSSNAQVYVSGATNEVVTNVNQTTNGGSWQPLAGDIFFTNGAGGNVAIYNNTGETNRGVAANAMRWVYDPAQDAPAGAVPAWWSAVYFGHTVSGSADADGDGYSNYAEYVFGTDPTDPASHLNFSVTSLAGGTVTVNFTPFQGGRLYQLLASTDLIAWTTLTNAASVDTNGNGFFTVTQPAAASAFYRLSATVTP